MNDEIGRWYWHIHHKILCEPLTEPLENRLRYIREEKAKTETPEQIALRLRLISPVVGPLPVPLVKAGADLDKAGADLDKAWAASDKARAADGKARAADGKAWAAYVKARAADGKAWAAYVKARAASDKAWAAYVNPDLEALHAIEHPDCPWNGKSIFS